LHPKPLDYAKVFSALRHRGEGLQEKIAKVKQNMQVLDAIGEQMKRADDGQISVTDPDARSMATSGRGWRPWPSSPRQQPAKAR
jgi:hypothetical protein